MAIVQGLFAMTMRSLGKVLNTVFGWATLLLFGKVSAQRQYLLSAIAFASALWLAAALGIAFPRLGAALVAFVPLPDSINKNAVRLGMVALAFILPLIVGTAGLFLLEGARRPRSVSATLKTVLKGYPYTFGLALTMLLMCIAAPLLKIRDLTKRWSSTHVPILVKSRDYPEVVADIRRILRHGGFETIPTQASWLIRWPTRIFTFFAGSVSDEMVARNMTVLRSGRLEALLHPSDLVIRGSNHDVVHARALITENLLFTKAYQTWSKDGNQLEERLATVWHEVQAHSSASARTIDQLRAIDETLHKIEVEYEEWEILFRQKIIVDQAACRGADRSDQKRNAPESVAASAPNELSNPWLFGAVVASVAFIGYLWRRWEAARP